MLHKREKVSELSRLLSIQLTIYIHKGYEELEDYAY